MNYNKISFIAASCNELSHQRPLIDSLLSQNNPDWELVVCQDGYNKEMRSFVESYKDARIIYTESPLKTGSYGCYNRLRALHNTITGSHVIPTSIQDYYLQSAVKLIHEYIEGVPDICTWDSINHLSGHEVLNVRLEQNYIDWGNFCLPVDKARTIGIPLPDEYCADWYTIKKGLDEKLFDNHVHIPFVLTIHN